MRKRENLRAPCNLDSYEKRLFSGHSTDIANAVGQDPVEGCLLLLLLFAVVLLVGKE